MTPPVCKYFLAGYCANGAACRFLHPEDADGSDGAGAKLVLARPFPSAFVRKRDIHVERRPPGPTLRPTAPHARVAVNFAETYAAVFSGDENVSTGAVGSVDASDDVGSIIDGLASCTPGTDGDEADAHALVRARGGSANSCYAVAAGSGQHFVPGRDAQPTAPSARPGGREHRRWAAVPQSVLMRTPTTLCKYHMDGKCRFGEDCRYVHGTFCSSCGRNALHPTDNEQAREHVQQCGTEVDFQSRQEASKTVECGICYESPLAHGRKFGLLRNCEHAFCIHCIRSWRGIDSAESFGRDAVRACPMCRTESHIVIPSDYYEGDVEKKEALLDAYKAKLGMIACKHYALGDGVCPFGTSCLYAHVDRDGNEPEKDATLLFSDTGATVKKTSTLSDYL